MSDIKIPPSKMFFWRLPPPDLLNKMGNGIK
jgi:hypothetical protein